MSTCRTARRSARRVVDRGTRQREVVRGVPGATAVCCSSSAADDGALSRAHLLKWRDRPRERRALVRALRGTGDRSIDTAAAAPLLSSLAGCRTAFDAHAIGRGRGLRPPRGPSLQVGPGPPNSPARSDGPGLIALHAWPTWCPRRRCRRRPSTQELPTGPGPAWSWKKHG